MKKMEQNMSMKNFQSFKTAENVNKMKKSKNNQSTKTLFNPTIPHEHFSFTANKENTKSNKSISIHCNTTPKNLKKDKSIKSLHQGFSLMSTINLSTPKKEEELQKTEEKSSSEINRTPLADVKMKENEGKKTIKISRKASMTTVVEKSSKYTGDTTSFVLSERKKSIPFKAKLSVSTSLASLQQVKTTEVDMKGKGLFLKTEMIKDEEGNETIKETLEEKPQFDDTFRFLYKSRKIGYLDEKPKYRWDGGYKDEAISRGKRGYGNHSIFQGERRFGVKENEAKKTHQPVFYS